MIKKFIASVIALVLVTTGTVNAEWIEGTKANTNPFDADYDKYYVFAKTYDKNGSGSFLILYQHKNSTNWVYLDLITTFDIYCASNIQCIRSVIDDDQNKTIQQANISDDRRTIQYGLWKKHRFEDYFGLDPKIKFQERYNRPSLRYFYKGNEIWMRIIDAKTEKVRYLHFDISGKPIWSW